MTEPLHTTGTASEDTMGAIAGVVAVLFCCELVMEAAVGGATGVVKPEAAGTFSTIEINT